MKFLKKIWNDNVWGKVIATIISGTLGFIFFYFAPKVTMFFNTLFSNTINLELSFLHTTILLAIIVAILSVLLFVIVRRQILMKRLRKWSGESISISELKSKFPNLTRISVVGISGVGKTTLIENVCRIRNTKILTLTPRAYIINFSNKKENYAALLDASGQSQSAQNDIALESQFIIVMLDHNISDLITSININRIEKHKVFIELLSDRFSTSSHMPKWIHFLLNKEDLWSQLSVKDKNLIKQFFNDQINILSKSLNDTRITQSFHSNNINASNTNLIIEINNQL